MKSLNTLEEIKKKKLLEADINKIIPKLLQINNNNQSRCYSNKII